MMDDAAKMRVLLVDDYDMTRTLLKIILRGGRFDVVGEATDGVEAVEMCARLKPDIVLLDVVMPKMNGIEALGHIKQQEHQALVLMVTSADEAAVVDEAMALGAGGFIVKPFNTASVIETMNAAREAFVVRQAANISRLS
jgi:two-component system chemotaxis response regulator CheY